MTKQSSNKIYLASHSPRRRELLRQINVDFELLLLRSHPGRTVDVSEVQYDGEAAADYVARVANEKAACAWNVMQLRQLAPLPILAADTTVVLDGRILGKPANRDEACAMLAQLSGRTHQVLTALALRYHAFHAQLTQVSQVRFGVLSSETIDAYCATPEPYDKAGGYGIQGPAALFVAHIEGSHSGIMGLPLFETAQLLRSAGLRLA